MERKFYPENFEKFLKGHADQFKMTPTKKVWHGIYNDLHPGRRWPSITMSLVFIFALVIVGHLNTNNEHNNTFNLKVLSASSSKTAPETEKTETKVSTSTINRNTRNTNTTASDNTVTLSDLTLTSRNSALLGKEKNIQSDNTQHIEVIQLNNTNVSADNPNLTSTSTETTVNTSTENVEPKDLQTENNEITSPETKTNLPVVESGTAAPSTTDKSAEIKSKKIRKNPAIVEFYISPSISYRNFSDSKMNNSVTHKPMIGYEAGGSINVGLYKQLRFTTGLQLNYTGYNIKANSTHPVLSTLLLNTDVAGQYQMYSTVSNYGNGSSTIPESKLKNYSVQISVPVGLQYSFGGNDNLKFSAEGTLQPSYILKSHGYVLSSDGKNYLSDPNIFTNWNMSTNIGTYVSVKSSSYNWQIGPQVRYQLFSTYTKYYPVKEHLINYGIRLGISKISK